MNRNKTVLKSQNAINNEAERSELNPWIAAFRSEQAKA
jgi:hypothetical protein